MRDLASRLALQVVALAGAKCRLSSFRMWQRSPSPGILSPRQLFSLYGEQRDLCDCNLIASTVSCYLTVTYMFVRDSRVVGRVARLALAFQGLAVLALPLALCCCVALAGQDGEDHGHHSHAVDSETTAPTHDADTCPHHSGPAAETPVDTPPGCEHLDTLVMALSALVGVVEQQTPLQGTLTETGFVPVPTLRLVAIPSSVESPPPRA